MIVRRSHSWKKKASALVITLLAVTVLAIILVAFIQAMEMERTNARSYRDILQANQAAEAGLDLAISQITTAIGTNQAFVTGNVNYPDTNFPLTVIGQRDLTNTNQLMPLVSGPTNLLSGFGNSNWANFASYAGVRTNSQPQVAVDLNTPEQYIQVTGDTNRYRAAWITMTNVVGATTNYSRLAYLVQDEQARLNPVLHTGQGTGLTNETNWYSGPQDLSLTNANGQILTPDQEQAALQSSNAVALSPQSLGQAFGSRTNYEVVKHLLTTASNPTYDVIPQWLLEGGQPKYNLNDLATNTAYGATDAARATNIASIINRNLINFASRDPVLRNVNPTLYLTRLAANMVDYVDSDITPTVITDPIADGSAGTDFQQESAGKDFPEPVLFITRMARSSHITNQVSTTITSQVYLQVWNPNTTPIVISGTLEIDLKNRPIIRWGTMTPTPLNDYTNQFVTNMTVRPNEFKLITFPQEGSQTFVSPTLVSTNDPTNSQYNFTPKDDNNPAYWPSFTNSTNVSPPGTIDHHNPYYLLKYNGVLVDMSREDAQGNGGLFQKTIVFDTDTNTTPPRNWFEVNNLQFVASGAPMGDPRFNSFSTQQWTFTYSAGQWHTNTAFGGRQPSYTTRSEDFKTDWANRDYVPVNPSPGVPSTDDYTAPSPDWSGYNSSADAPAAISVMRNGPMVSIGELGHIFDPSYGDDNLSATGFASGGGRTLRIGQPEFTVSGQNNWNTNGRRATELLDLFTVNPTNAGSPSARGRINPNTAPVEVLAAVLAGIQIDSDQINSSSLSYHTLAASNVANAIITNRPYSSLSDLYKALPAFAAATNYNPAFDVQMGGGTTNLAAFDRVREEAFGKLVQHLSV